MILASGAGGGAPRARLQGREVAELWGPWNPKQSGAAKIARVALRKRKYRTEPAVGCARVFWVWEVRVVPRARARAASVCVCVCVCVCVRERERPRDQEGLWNRGVLAAG